MNRFKTLKEVEIEHIRSALEATNGCMLRSSKALGISYKSMYDRCARFGIDYNDYRRVAPSAAGAEKQLPVGRIA